VGLLPDREPPVRGLALDLEMSAARHDTTDVAKPRLARVDKTGSALDASTSLPPTEQTNVLQDVENLGLDLCFGSQMYIS